jgi:hypothetical protein
MLFPTIMASAALFTMGIANPMPADVLAKPGEGIHLAVCENTQSTAIVPRSFVIVSSYFCHLRYVSPSYYGRQYCANDNNCQLDDPYNSDNAVIVGDPSFNWEGAGYTATFRTGVRFHFHIDADAKSKPNYTPVE